MSKANRPIFVTQQVSNHGTSNPIIARLGPQVIELCDFFELNKKQKEGLFDILHDKVGKRCLESFDIYKAFEDDIFKIRAEIQTRGMQYQSNGKVLDLPSISNIQQRAERFLYVSKLILRDLAEIFNVFFNKDFNNQNGLYKKILDWAKSEFGAEDPIYLQVKKDYDSWIKELIAKRNAIEHPGGYSGTFYIKDYSYIRHDGANKICEPIWYRNSEQPTHILFDMEIFVHNCFTFSEEIFILCLNKMPRLAGMPLRIVEIPEQERNSNNPIRFKVVT